MLDLIWMDAAGSFIGNGLLISVIWGFWKFEKAHKEGEFTGAPAFVAGMAILLPLFFIGTTLYLDG